MKIQWIEYKEAKILYSDYRTLNPNEMIAQLQQETRLILQQKEPILYLANVTNTVISSEFMKEVNKDGRLTRTHVKKSAIIGVIGLKAIMLNTFNMITGIQARAFTDEIDAKEYLVA